MSEVSSRRRAATGLTAWVTAITLLGLGGSAAATGPIMHAGQLAHALDRLATTTRVLYVAAHPDDENTRLLAHLANERHLAVAYLSMTRGGGGQNLIGSEQGELLDVIRTEELLAARALDGALQRFSRMRDFGYSKSATETLSWWGREEALSDVVRVIRTFQPDVIITRFDEQPPNHGHHTASAILAREAFAAAADPARFPEQRLAPWKALRLLHNVPTWRDAPVPEGAVTVDVGGYDARLGLGYGELAALSRSEHKSQGFGMPGERGPLLERFVLVAGTPAKTDVLEGAPAGWERYGEPGLQFVRAIDEARSTLERDRPENAAAALARAHVTLAKLPDDVRTRDARAGLERVLAASVGLFARATATRPSATPGSTVEVQLELVARRPSEVRLERVLFPGDREVEVGAKLGVNEKRIVKHAVALPAEKAVSLPYWLASEPSRGRYEVKDPSLIGAPRGPAALTVAAHVVIAGRPIRIEVPVVHAWTDRVQGERVRPFLVVPPATVTPVREAVLSVNGEPAPVLLRVRAGGDRVKGEVRLNAGKGWRVKPSAVPVELSRAGDETTVRFEVTPEAGASAVEITPSFHTAGRGWAFREDVIDYPHIPLQLVLQPASLRLAPVTLKVPKGIVGYVVGSGDSLPEDLAHVGVNVELIDDVTLRSGELERYAAIVLGIRAYNARPAVRASHPRLMRYVERGGKLVVQYNTTSRWAPLEGPVGPYPFEIGSERITDERAAMLPVDPAHALLNEPNEIVASDFEGWVQERGIYFAKTWDARYSPLLEAADPDEQPLRGAAIVARYGKGRYVYTGLAFFRQTRAGVPGAYRLFLNFIGGK